jgi:hypothetical protein
MMRLAVGAALFLIFLDVGSAVVPGAGMDSQDVLYALSTLAQTCAALAAFVGAVGLYRLQLLRTAQDTIERDVRGLASRANLVGSDLAALYPFRRIAADVAKAIPEGEALIAAQEALKDWNTFPSIIQRSRNVLIVFEVWNLCVIGLSLFGFNYVALLASSPYSFWGLSAVALGTVGVTLYCVCAWTRGRIPRTGG